MGELTFRSKPVQQLRLLAHQRSARRDSGLFVAEGPKLLVEAAAAGAAVKSVYLDVSTATEAHVLLADQFERSGATVHRTGPGVLARATESVSPQPIAALVRASEPQLASLTGPFSAPVLVCVDVADPGNAGTVVRSAAAAGAAAVVFCAGAVDVYNPKAVRASAGAVFRVPLLSGVEPAVGLGHLAGTGAKIFGTVARGGTSPDATDLTGSLAVVLGGESRGLPAEVGAMTGEALTIPMVEGTESLNVAMAATIVCFEAARQRRLGSGA